MGMGPTLFETPSAPERRAKYLAWMLTFILARPAGDPLRRREASRILERMAKNESLRSRAADSGRR